MIKKAPFAFVSCVLIIGVVIFFGVGAIEEWHYAGTISENEATITAKEADLGQKDETIRTISEERDAANRENEKLRNENAEYQASRDEKEFPLKKRAQILANQINRYADEIFDTLKSSSGYNQWEQKSEEWQDRFVPRIEVMLKQMDELDQHSDLFETNNISYVFNTQPQNAPNQLKAMAAELNKLADGLPDVASP